MPYRCNINYVLSQDQNIELSIDLLSQIILYVLILLQYINKQCDRILCRLIRCLENQLLNVSCMESGKDIHLERTTSCQSSVPQLDTTNGELLAQLGPTASNIDEGNLSTHERWPNFVY